MAKTQFSQKDYERLGQEVGELIKAEYDSVPRVAWRHFVGGVFSGLGGVVGATVMVATMIWLLHQLGGLPFVGHYLNNVSNTIQSKPQK